MFSVFLVLLAGVTGVTGITGEQTPQSRCDSSPSLGEQETNLLCRVATSPPNSGGVWLWVESVAYATPKPLPHLPCVRRGNTPHLHTKLYPLPLFLGIFLIPVRLQGGDSCFSCFSFHKIYSRKKALYLRR